MSARDASARFHDCYFASFSRNRLRAFATFGAITTAQYGFCGLRAK